MSFTSINLLTPTDVNLLNNVFRDPVTGLIVFPTWSYNLNDSDSDYVNDDPKYQAKMIEHIRIRLKEKWLYNDPVFRKLLRYFDAKKVNDECKVQMITDVDKPNSTKLDSDVRRCVFRYIEKLFISKKFVEKTLRQYVLSRRVKWYDLLEMSDELKQRFADKLERQILTCLYNTDDK